MANAHVWDLQKKSFTELTTEKTAQNVILSNSFAPDAFDEVAVTYVAAGNGTGEIETVTYKLSSVTQATLTLSYDASNRLSGVSKS